MSLGNFHEECLVELCPKPEELKELYEDYDEECYRETCSPEEVSEIAGGGAYVDDMLDAFLDANYTVLSSTFNRQAAPSGGRIWL